MGLRIATFNLNNLFSRWNFKSELVRDGDRRGWHLDRGGGAWVRRFEGSVVQPKPEAATNRLAERIRELAPDVLAVQEVEDRDTLREFNEKRLGGAFAECVLVEGNDRRLIDVGLLSRLPVGEVRSFQRVRHPELPGEPVFRRDFLWVEILAPDRARRLMWVGVAHLKSQFLDWRIKDPEERRRAAGEAGRIRRLEAESIARIVEPLSRAQEPFVVCGDFNDVPESDALAPLLGKRRRSLGLVNLVAEHVRDPEGRWTVSHKETGQSRTFAQFDYLLVPGFLDGKVGQVAVARRSSGPASPDGSDHDPVVAELGFG